MYATIIWTIHPIFVAKSIRSSFKIGALKIKGFLIFFKKLNKI